MRELLLRCLLGKEYGALEIGRFRLSGEIHQWMYDRVSLARLLEDLGFHNIGVYDSSHSGIKEFSLYHLDTEDDGSTRKPDSLFMEATKRT